MWWCRFYTQQHRNGWFIGKRNEKLPMKEHNCAIYDGWLIRKLPRRLMTSQITSVSIVCSTIGSGADQRKHQSSASLACVWRIHQWLANALHKRPVTRKMFPFDDVIMIVLVMSQSTLGFPVSMPGMHTSNEKALIQFGVRILTYFSYCPNGRQLVLCNRLSAASGQGCYPVNGYYPIWRYI